MNSANPPAPPPDYPPLDVGGEKALRINLSKEQSQAIKAELSLIADGQKIIFQPFMDPDNELARQQREKIAQVKNENTGAFPWVRGAYDGLTKREYFAAMAMQGLCAGGIASGITGIAVNAIHLADATLAELEKTK